VGVCHGSHWEGYEEVEYHFGTLFEEGKKVRFDVLVHLVH
jgi:hypothetical protein